jgi:hypothetical protein
MRNHGILIPKLEDSIYAKLFFSEQKAFNENFYLYLLLKEMSSFKPIIP